MDNLNERILRRQAELLKQAVDALESRVCGQGHPADRSLALFFKNRRELGARDRRFIAGALFSRFRWLGWTRALELSFPEDVALSLLLDGCEVHGALQSAVREDWAPLLGRSLGEKIERLARWFPDAAPLRLHDLIPPGFAERIGLPDGCEEPFYTALQSRPPTWLRLRHAGFSEALSAAGIEGAVHPRVAGAVSVAGGAPLAAAGHPGQVEVQDLSSQAVGLIAAPEPGSSWWDACCGAGGKALHLADLAGPDCRVIATDVRPEALRECRRRARVDGIAAIRTQLHDVGKAPFGRTFDGVLVDAPCSGVGTWGRNPDARWRTSLRDPAQKRNLQLRMLNHAATCVKPGGQLVYAVCTVTREETLEVVERFLGSGLPFALDPFASPLTGEMTDGRLQIWPWEGPCDGMFIARFRRN